MLKYFRCLVSVFFVLVTCFGFAAFAGLPQDAERLIGQVTFLASLKGKLSHPLYNIPAGRGLPVEAPEFQYKQLIKLAEELKGMILAEQKRYSPDTFDESASSPTTFVEEDPYVVSLRLLQSKLKDISGIDERSPEFTMRTGSRARVIDTALSERVKRLPEIKAVFRTVVKDVDGDDGEYTKYAKKVPRLIQAMKNQFERGPVAVLDTVTQAATAGDPEVAEAIGRLEEINAELDARRTELAAHRTELVLCKGELGATTTACLATKAERAAEEVRLAEVQSRAESARRELEECTRQLGAQRAECEAVARELAALRSDAKTLTAVQAAADTLPRQAPWASAVLPPSSLGGGGLYTQLVPAANGGAGLQATAPPVEATTASTLLYIYDFIFIV